MRTVLFLVWIFMTMNKFYRKLVISLFCLIVLNIQSYSQNREATDGPFISLEDYEPEMFMRAKKFWPAEINTCSFDWEADSQNPKYISQIDSLDAKRYNEVLGSLRHLKPPIENTGSEKLCYWPVEKLSDSLGWRLKCSLSELMRYKPCRSLKEDYYNLLNRYGNCVNLNIAFALSKLGLVDSSTKIIKDVWPAIMNLNDQIECIYYLRQNGTTEAKALLISIANTANNDYLKALSCLSLTQLNVATNQDLKLSLLNNPEKFISVIGLFTLAYADGLASEKYISTKVSDEKLVKETAISILNQLNRKK